MHLFIHYTNIIMGTMASQITSLTIVYSTAYLGAEQRKHQSSASLAFVWVIHRGLVNSLHKWPVTRKIFPFHDVILHQFFFSGMEPGPLYSLSGKTSYRQSSWNLAAARLEVRIMIESLWRLTGNLACQISERLEKSKPESRGFETLRDLAVQRPSA